MFRLSSTKIVGLLNFIEKRKLRMSIGLIGRKCGMTRIFTEDGVSIPVTVVHVEPNRVAQVKSVDVDGYRAIQVTTGNRKISKVSKSEAGHYAKANIEAGRGLWEFRLDAGEADVTVGADIGVDLFEEGQSVDVSARSIGKGYAGGVKRYNFSTQDMTHGNSLSHRSAGSIGQCQTPGRVFKGKKMAGQMGAVNATIQNLTVVSVDSDKNLLLIKGGIPGAKGSDVIVGHAVKMRNKG